MESRRSCATKPVVVQPHAAASAHEAVGKKRRTKYGCCCRRRSLRDECIEMSDFRKADYLALEMGFWH